MIFLFPFSRFSSLHGNPAYIEEADLLDDTEKVDVGVVDGKVEEDGARAPVDPEVLLEVGHDGDSLGLGGGQVLDVASPAVRRDLS